MWKVLKTNHVEEPAFLLSIQECRFEKKTYTSVWLYMTA